MANQRSLGIFIFLIIVVGLGAYYLGGQKNPPPSSPTPTPAATEINPVDPTANWKTYQGEGYSFKYPPMMIMRNYREGEFTGISVTSTEETTTNFIRIRTILVTGTQDARGLAERQRLAEEKLAEQYQPSSVTITATPLEEKIVNRKTGFMYTTQGSQGIGSAKSLFISLGSGVLRISSIYDGPDVDRDNYSTLTDQIFATLTFTP